MYTAFAGVYDRLMDQVDYAAWAKHYAALMQKYGVQKGARCTECACGTGSITIPLRKMGYQMTGVDLSQDMLELAMEKAGKAGIFIPFICQDMTELQLPRRADCILATCDGVNYLADAKAAKAFFNAAFCALKSGGALIFDISTPEKLENTLGNHTLFSDEDEISYIWQNAWDGEKQQVEMQLSIFERQRDGRYLRFEEHQIQRAHAKEEIAAWLHEAGFSDIAFFGAFRMDAPAPGDDRWHIAAIKPEEI